MSLITDRDSAAGPAKRIARKGALALLLACGVVAVGAVSSASAATDVSMAGVGSCGDLRIKTSLWGAWARHAGCNFAETAAIAPDGRAIAVLNQDGDLLIKLGLWEEWRNHHGDTKAFALGPYNMVARVGSCGNVDMKLGRPWAQWQHIEGCGFASAVAISPNGRMLAVRTPQRELKVRYDWGVEGSPWQVHDHFTDGLALGPSKMMASLSHCGWPRASSLRIKWDAPLSVWDLHYGCDLNAAAISPDGETIAALTYYGDLIAKVGLWGDWQLHHGGMKAIALGPAIPEPL
jgi:hypothetical protein